MQKFVLFLIFLLINSKIFPQAFEIKQITSGDFNAKNPIISVYGFENAGICFEKRVENASNIIRIKYDSYTNSFEDTVELTSGNWMNINPYEDFSQGIVFQTNANGNWDIAYRPYSIGNWGPVKFLVSTEQDETNLSPFYRSEIGFPGNNFILFERSDTIIVLEYNETMKTEYPALINSSQYNYSDYIGIYYYNVPGYYPRPGIHVIAVETDSAGNKNLISRYKPNNGNWDTINIIKEDCKSSNPTMQFVDYTPYLVFEDSISSGRRIFRVFDWEYFKDVDIVPNLVAGDLKGFRSDRPMIITLNPSQFFELEYTPHSYFVESGNELKLRLNKQEYGSIVGDTLIDVNFQSSRMALGALGFDLDEIFYTIWEDSISGHVHLFGKRQLYPIDFVSEKKSDINFFLKQNYPNPFNPSTKIKFTVASNVKGEMSNVILKVYDILGNEIATLVNEKLSMGEYEVEFGGHSGEDRNLPSGIYFYQLKSGKFVETKKMILLK